jgi:hypothetical protein
MEPLFFRYFCEYNALIFRQLFLCLFFLIFFAFLFVYMESFYVLPYVATGLHRLFTLCLILRIMSNKNLPKVETTVNSVTPEVNVAAEVMAAEVIVPDDAVQIGTHTFIVPAPAPAPAPADNDLDAEINAAMIAYQAAMDALAAAKAKKLAITLQPIKDKFAACGTMDAIIQLCKNTIISHRKGASANNVIAANVTGSKLEKTSNNKAAILALFGEDHDLCLTAKDCADNGLNRNTCGRDLGDMVKAGSLIKADKGYKLAPAK